MPVVLSKAIALNTVMPGDICRALQLLCSRFDLTDELSVLLNGMRMQARQLDTTSARLLANNAIQDLDSFVKTLADELPHASVIGGRLMCLLHQCYGSAACS